MTDFLKTRLLDTLSDQIRKIQKVRECKGSARGHCAPLGTARGRGSGLSTNTFPGDLAWGRD